MNQKLKVIVALVALLAAGTIFSNTALAGDSCPSSIIGIHGVLEWDSYGSSADFQGTINHVLYYDFKNPQTSMVDSTYSGCQQFQDIVSVIESPYDSAFLSPGLQWANNNSCPTISGCGPLDDDGMILANDRVVMVVYDSSQTAPYQSRMLVDSVGYDETYSRFGFDKSAGYAVKHEMLNMVAPQVMSETSDGTNTTFTLKIQEPSFDVMGVNGGLYGDDANVADRLIAGYRVVAMSSSEAPTNGLIGAGNWDMAIDDDDRYIPSSAIPSGAWLTSFEITLNAGDTNLYVAYAPIFNYANGCAAATCTVGELKTLDALGGALNNSLTSRIASAAAPVAVVAPEPAPKPTPKPLPPTPKPGPAPVPTPKPSPTPIPPTPTPAPSVEITGINQDSRQVQVLWTSGSEKGAVGFYTYVSMNGQTWKLATGTFIPVRGAGSQYSETFKVGKNRAVKVVMINAASSVLAFDTASLK